MDPGILGRRGCRATWKMTHAANWFKANFEKRSLKNCWISVKNSWYSVKIPSNSPEKQWFWAKVVVCDANFSKQTKIVIIDETCRFSSLERCKGVFRPGRASKNRIFMLSRQYFQGIFWVVFPGFFPLGTPKVQRIANFVDLEKCWKWLFTCKIRCRYSGERAPQS